MNKMSPLGAFCIAFFIQQWNACNDTERKVAVREAFVSNKITEGIKLMQCLINEQLMYHQCSVYGLGLWQDVFETLAALMVPAPADDQTSGKSFHPKMVGVAIMAKIEVTMYFESVFKETGQFEQIKMPVFSLKDILPFPGDGEPGVPDKKRNELKENFMTGKNFCAGAPGIAEKILGEEIRFGPQKK